GIRDFHVTGVQTCALPIYRGTGFETTRVGEMDVDSVCGLEAQPAHHDDEACEQPQCHEDENAYLDFDAAVLAHERSLRYQLFYRSEERRVGKECRSRRMT